MSFTYCDRSEDDCLNDTPWMRRSRTPQCDRAVYDCLDEHDVGKNGMTGEDGNLENFYCGGL